MPPGLNWRDVCLLVDVLCELGVSPACRGDEPEWAGWGDRPMTIELVYGYLCDALEHRFQPRLPPVAAPVLLATLRATSR